MISLAILNQEQEFFPAKGQIVSIQTSQFKGEKKNQNYCVRKKISELLTK